MTEAYLVSTICLNSSYSKSFPCKSWFVTFYIFKKKIYEFSTHSPALTFSTDKNSLLATQLRVNSFANNLHFNTYSTHRGQSPDTQQPIKEPSLKYYPFLSLSISSPERDRNISLDRVYWRYNSFSLLVAVKLRGIIFLKRLTVYE